jgi:glycosyltransferase involved in cell wall biosynthesis
MKILIVTDMYYPDINGCSYFAQRLAYYKKAEGHEVAVVAPSRFLKHTDEKKNNIRIFGISSVSILKKNKDLRLPHPFFIQFQMKKILKEFQPDVIHLQGHFTINRAMLKVAQEEGYPVVATNHFMPDNLTHYLPFPKKIIGWVDEFMWSDFAKVFNKVPFITTPTEIAADIIRPLLSVPVISITNGIDLEKFNPKNNGEYMRKRFGIPKNKPVLLYLGRLEAEKHVEQIIEASAKAMKQADFSLVIGGKGFENINLQKLAKKLKIDNKTFFTGFIPDEDLPYFYKISDCFANACPFELQCLAIMEAMATGIPIIAVNAGALPHLVKNGINGTLFEFGDISTLVKQIIYIMSHKEKRQKMGLASLHLIKTHSIKIMVEKYLAVYKQSINDKKIANKF